MTEAEAKLIELAGLAAGYVRIRVVNGIPKVWNPLESDGDAMRLAVQLGFRLFCSSSSSHGSPGYCEAKWSGAGIVTRYWDWHDNDKDKAMRYAIVMAAADMCIQTGKHKEMQQGESLADHNNDVNAAPVELSQDDFDNVVSMPAFREKQNAPDANLVVLDDDGVMWFTYGVDYADQAGCKMSFHIWAKSFNDANERLKQIQTNGRVYGQILSDNIPL